MNGFTQQKCIYDPLTEFMRHYAGSVQELPARHTDESSLEERLQQRIVDGNSIGLAADLDIALQDYSPLDIINGILLSGMKSVGELFGSGQMQLPFVLQSAETMKTAVGYLERFMDRVDGGQKGTLVLATVKGDVHDIGKNLVDIILTNNGYKVVNLGIKVPVETILGAAREHAADAIGMSGLLVKSTVVMKENLELMRHRDITIPVVLGGAALTRRYVENDLRAVYDGHLAYANDAFDGLTFMENVIAGTLNGLQVAGDRERPLSGTEAKVSANDSEPEFHSGQSGVSREVPVPVVPFFGSRIVTDIPLETVFAYINEVALVRGQWQVRRGSMSETQYDELLRQEILPALERVKLQAKRESVLAPAVVYGYFPCWADGNDLVIARPRDLPDESLASQWPSTRYAKSDLVQWQRFRFPRQRGDRKLCIADFFRSVEADETDVCAFHLVTMGKRASEYTAALFSENKYQEYLYMHGLTVECAEALAEYWHKVIRREMQIDAGDAGELRRLFSQGYQGSRYSFGYPACPNLEDHRILFELLHPERIGVALTEEWQLVPEQSTSAIITHHPQARYFIIKD